MDLYRIPEKYFDYRAPGPDRGVLDVEAHRKNQLVFVGKTSILLFFHLTCCSHLRLGGNSLQDSQRSLSEVHVVEWYERHRIVDKDLAWNILQKAREKKRLPVPADASVPESLLVTAKKKKLESAAEVYVIEIQSVTIDDVSPEQLERLIGSLDRLEYKDLPVLNDDDTINYFGLEYYLNQDDKHPVTLQPRRYIRSDPSFDYYFNQWYYSTKSKRLKGAGQIKIGNQTINHFTDDFSDSDLLAADYFLSFTFFGVFVNAYTEDHTKPALLVGGDLENRARALIRNSVDFNKKVQEFKAGMTSILLLSFHPHPDSPLYCLTFPICSDREDQVAHRQPRPLLHSQRRNRGRAAIALPHRGPPCLDREVHGGRRR